MTWCTRTHTCSPTPPAVGVIEAGRRLVVLADAHLAPRLVEGGAVHPGVQEHRVHRVHRVLGDLQPVAGVVSGVGHALRIDHVEGVVDGKRGPVPGRSQVCEHHAVAHLHRIGGLADLGQERGVRGLRRRLQQRAVHVEAPSVVAAAQAPLLALAVLERGVPVRAVPMEQPVASPEITEEHQVFAEHPHQEGDVRYFGAERHRMPEAPQVFPARRSRSHVSEFGVLRALRGLGVAGVLRRAAHIAHGLEPSLFHLTRIL